MRKLARAVSPQKRPLTPTKLPINDFGAYLRFLRDRKRLTQEELLLALDQKFEDYDVASLTKDMYRRIEAGRRAPQFEELLPLLAGMVESCELSREDIHTCLRLARLKLENLQRKKPQARSDGEWRLLEIQLTQLATQTRSATADAALQAIEKPELSPRLSFDTSHLLGREAWVERMISYLTAQRKKFITILGMMGEGKTSGLKWLLQRLLELDGYYPIFYTFSTAEDRTPTDQLSAFVSAILAELHVSDPDGKTPPLEKQMEQVLTRLAELSQRVVFLVDDAHLVLDGQGQLTPEWDRFLRAFVASDHHATLFWAAREWPSWRGRDRGLVVDGNAAQLPALSPEACAEIWRRMGFDDVEDTLLRQASAKYGYNPLMIELRGKSLLRPRVNFAWPEEMDPEEEQEPLSEHQRLIRELLREKQTFGALDVDVRHQLKQVVSHRLTQDGLQTLEVLAASSLPLPLPLLMEVTPQADYALAELSNASLIDRTSLASNRAQLQPLTREAGLQRLQESKRLGETEALLIPLYQRWLEKGNFHDELEMASLVSELAALYLKQRQLLQAAELLVEYGWLMLAFGHGARVARIAEGTMRAFNWRTTADNEFGGLLLQYHLLIHFSKEDLSASDRKKAYLHLWDVMAAGEVPFRVQTFVHLTTHKLLYMTRERHYEEAWSLVNELCERYADLQQNKPTTYAELLDRRAFVRGRWGDYQDAQAKKPEEPGMAEHLRLEAFQHRQEAVAIHQQCIDLLLQCERFASPIEQSRIRFKRARLLNDLAYYQRCVGLLAEARLSMKECLRLKESGYVVPISLAVSYDDFSQLLSELGAFQGAKSYSDRSLQIVQEQIAGGNRSALHEKGMFLINRGKLFLLLGQLEEAGALFKEGIPLVEGTTRDDKVATAREGLRIIDAWRKNNPRNHLDWKWFVRFQDLANYSDVALLAQAGPFLAEEQREWELLWPQRGEDTAKKRLAALITQSRKRELDACWTERRNPSGIHYPRVDQTEVLSRITCFEQLSEEIRQHEQNAIVRKLYLRSIEERLDELHLIGAAGKQDDEQFWEYNQRLNGLPNPPEIELALRYLADLLRRGLKDENAKGLSEQIIQQTRQWSLYPMDLEPVPDEMKNGMQALSSDTATKLFSPETVQRFFSEVFRRYQFDWTVVWDGTTDHPWVSFSQRRLFLPEGKDMTTTKLRQLLGHEIEMHAFRSSSGARSPLALLSTGLDGSLDAEEGLALDYTEDTANSWFGTLATSLATGAICQPYSFIDLLSFFEMVNLLKNLLGKKDASLEELQRDARIRAQNRGLRTWRGVSHFAPGICSTKDTVYLRGYLAVKAALEGGTVIFDQLMTGAVGLHHLDDLAELGIVRPSVPHLRLSSDPNLEQYISQFAGVQEN